MSQNQRSGGLMTWGIMLLALSIGVAPRIPLPVYLPARTFDLRFDDIIIAMMALIWSLSLLVRPRIHRTPLIGPITAYLIVIVVTAALAVLSEPANMLRMALYILKEVEYFLIFLIVANWVRSERDLRKISAAILLGGVFNLAWAGVQVLTGNIRQFFLFDVPETAYASTSRLGHYGVVLIGETSPLSVGAFFAFVSFLCYSYALFDRRSARTWLFLAFGIGSSLSSILAGIKLSIVFLGVGVLTLAVFAGRRVLRLVLVVAVVAVLAGTLASAGSAWLAQGQKLADVERVFYWESYLGAISEDRLLRWRDLFGVAWNSILAGTGTGNLVYLPAEDVFIDEAHNHYLRVLLDAGIFGLLAFLWVLFRAGRMCLSVASRARSGISRIVSSTALGVLLALGAGAVAQDAFRPVIPNEFLWILVGLTAAAYRMQHRGQRVHSYVGRSEVPQPRSPGVRLGAWTGVR